MLEAPRRQKQPSPRGRRPAHARLASLASFVDVAWMFLPMIAAFCANSECCCLASLRASAASLAAASAPTAPSPSLARRRSATARSSPVRSRHGATAPPPPRPPPRCTASALILARPAFPARRGEIRPPSGAPSPYRSAPTLSIPPSPLPRYARYPRVSPARPSQQPAPSCSARPAARRGGARRGAQQCAARGARAQCKLSEPLLTALGPDQPRAASARPPAPCRARCVARRGTRAARPAAARMRHALPREVSNPNPHAARSPINGHQTSDVNPLRRNTLQRGARAPAL